MEKFKQLNVWRKMHQLVLDVYRVTSMYPDAEKFGLTSQMRRCAVSVAANIAEGSKGRTVADRTRFHVMADGSLQELKYYLILSVDLKLMDEATQSKLYDTADEVGKMLGGLTKSLKRTGEFQLTAAG